MRSVSTRLSLTRRTTTSSIDINLCVVYNNVGLLQLACTAPGGWPLSNSQNTKASHTWSLSEHNLDLEDLVPHTSTIPVGSIIQVVSIIHVTSSFVITHAEPVIPFR